VCNSEILFVILLTALVNKLTAQTTQKSIDSLLVNIDKVELTSNVLYDRVMPIANLTIYNDSINICNTKYFEQALFELHKSSNEQKFVSYQFLREHYTSIDDYNIVDIGVINARFHQLNFIPDNLSKSALKLINDKFERINTEKPIFIPREALIISPLKEYVTGNTITYHFDNLFLIEENSTKTISSIMANFDTDDNYTIYQNDTFTHSNLNISYNETGFKILTFVATYSDGSTKTTQAELHVKVTPPPPRGNLSVLKHFTSTLSYQGDGESNPTYGRLDYRIFYSDNNTENKILKPILILDGFDPLDKRKIVDADPHDLSDEKHKSIVELMIYYDSENIKQHIIKKLNKPPNNFDVIIINPIRFHNGTKWIDGGADFIERNGLSHASFIQFINEKLTTNNSQEELIVMGPSMGGLISRYALAYMEKKYQETGLEEWNHNCKLWVSMDSPHLGANISLGIQSLLNQAKWNSVESMDFVLKELGSPAARQMLIEQVCFTDFPPMADDIEQLNDIYMNAKTISQGFSENRGHPYFIQFYDNLYGNGVANSRGYPVQENLKKVALINGSLSASKDFLYHGEIKTYLDDAQKAVGVKGFQHFTWFWGETSHLRLGDLEAYAMPSFGNRSKVSFFEKFYKSQSKFATNINSRGVLDNTPGSYFGTFDDVIGALGNDPLAAPNHANSIWNFPSFIDFRLFSIASMSDSFGGATFDINTNKHAHTFMPVASTLGFIEPDFDWTDPIDCNLVVTNKIPFDSYYGESLNTDHITFTENSFNWLLGWITGNDEAQPPVFSTSIIIEGSDDICTSDSESIYTILDIPEDTDVTWSFPDNMMYIIDGQGTTSCFFGAFTNGQATISATFSSDCLGDNITLTKEIEILSGGSPLEIVASTTPSNIFYDASFNDNDIQTFRLAENINGADDYDLEWENTILSIGDNDTYSSSGGYFSIIKRDSTPLIIKTKATNGSSSCSDTEWSNEITHYIGTIPNGQEGNWNLPEPFPNSSDDSFKIDFTDKPVSTQYYIYLYDQYSNVKYSGESNNIEKTINTFDLDNGTYYLHVYEDGVLNIKQILVIH